MKRIAIAGAGVWSSNMHLPALKRVQAEGKAEYVAVCDLDRKRAAAYAADLGAKSFTDVADMLAETRADGLVILLPPGVAPSLIESCIDRRLPFLTEKPPATDLKTHRRLLDKLGELPHVVAYNRRHAPYLRQALEWMQGAWLQSVFGDFSRYDRRDADFTATAVHGIDAVQCLAREDLEQARIEVAPVEGAVDGYLSGWTASGTRIDLRITPTTGSAREHYIVSARERSVVVAYPQTHMIDLPGWVELHEKNRVVARRTAQDYGLADSDSPGLGGIVREHELFVQILEGEAEAWSTLKTSLSTQVLREALAGLIRAGGRRACDIDLTRHGQ